MQSSFCSELLASSFPCGKSCSCFLYCFSQPTPSAIPVSTSKLIPRQRKQALYAYTAKQLLETDSTLSKFDSVAASFISGTCGSACVMLSILPTILSDRGIQKTLTPDP